MTLLQGWHRDGLGGLRRRGLQTKGGVIIDEDFEALEVAASLGTNPAGVEAFRAAVHDPDYGYIEAQHARMAVVDLGGSEGKTIRVNYDDEWYQSATNNGIAYQPDLPRSVDAARVTFASRFNSPFVSGKGGKFGVGLGWSNRHRQPASGGSTSQPHAGSFRWMWRDDFRLSPYLYDANGTNGIGLATTPASPTHPDDYGLHVYEFDLVLNTAHVDSGPIGAPVDEGTLTLGVDYLANGVLTCRVDGETIYHSNSRVHRKFSDTMITHLMWSWFRGGGDLTWDVTGGPYYIDLPWYMVVEL